jgi:hypothetical protein
MICVGLGLAYEHDDTKHMMALAEWELGIAVYALAF